jgi:Ohr subfamily peroxiredoxin
MEPIYWTEVTATGGRNGKVASSDGVLEHEVRIPKEMGGQGGNYTNPEQLFAAGYAACFDSALNFVALQNKMKLQNTKVTANVGLINSPEQGFSITVELDVEIPGIEHEAALHLLDLAHATCPYSKATRNNVPVKINLIQN